MNSLKTKITALIAVVELTGNKVGLETLKEIELELSNQKNLIQLRTKVEFYQKLGRKIEKILLSEIDIEDYAQEIYNKTVNLENELEDYKTDINLPDSVWYEDEKV